jgi:hypothetical protein
MDLRGDLPALPLRRVHRRAAGDAAGRPCCGWMRRGGRAAGCAAGVLAAGASEGPVRGSVPRVRPGGGGVAGSRRRLRGGPWRGGRAV